MNERIRELAEQAKEHANSYDDAGTPIWFQFYNEKFALLIVQECADIQMKRSCERHGYDKYEDAKEIKEHFGVTE